MKKVNIILPVYNEAEIIEEFNCELFKVLDELSNSYEFEVKYVVDKCRDNTLKILETLASKNDRIVLIGLSKRFGHQMSLVAGIDDCDSSCDAAIMMDCDLEHPPKVIKELLAKYEEGFDVVNTERIYNEKVSFIKRTTSKLFYKVLNWLSEDSFKEGAADFRLISNKVIKVFKQDIREHNQFLRGLFQWVGFEQAYVVFKSETRTKGSSKYSIKRLIRFASNGVISFSKTPLKVSIYIGSILSCLSIIYGIYSIISYLIYDTHIQGWASTISLLSFIGGVQLIVLGIIGEYIGEIFDEVKKRPLYIIEKRVDNKSLMKKNNMLKDDLGNE